MRGEKAALTVWMREMLTVLAVGLASWALAQAMSLWATRTGHNGWMLGIIFGQAVIFAALILQKELRLPQINWGRGRVIAGMMAGVAVWMAALVVTWVLSAGLEKWGWQSAEQAMVTYMRGAGRLEFAFLAIVAGFWAPMVEEIYFRGWLQGLVGQKMRPWETILLVAFVFALLHGIGVFSLGIFFAGVVFGVVAWRWGLVSATVAHIIFNTMTVFAARGGWL